MPHALSPQFLDLIKQTLPTPATFGEIVDHSVAMLGGVMFYDAIAQREE